MPRRMARAVQHTEVLAGDLYDLAFGKPPVRRDAGQARDAVLRRLVWDGVEQGLVIPVRPLAARPCLHRLIATWP